jgi:alpha-1,6-mannosyltransferase
VRDGLAGGAEVMVLHCGGLPVRFLGHLSDPGALAAVLASADVAIAPGPVETFGLAVAGYRRCHAAAGVRERCHRVAC